MTNWVDAHTHLDSDPLYSSVNAILDRATNAGVHTLLLVNSEANSDSFSKTIECCELQHSSRRFASVGVHPHHADSYSDSLRQNLWDLLENRNVVAVGEIGLDYYYNFSQPETQRAVLKQQLLISLEKELPVVIHCRDAYNELADILHAESAAWSGMIHCFTGTPAEAERLLTLGFFISFAGIVTFKNAHVLRQAAKIVPADRILVETDAPYLAPVPHRGKTNEPAFVAETGRFLAELRNVPVEDFSQTVVRNFHSLFGLRGRV